MPQNSIELLGVGDIGPLEGEMSHYSALVRPRLKSADILFGNCERLYTTKGTKQNNGHTYNRLDPAWASIFTDSGFDVVSLASNHAMDMGADAMLGTRETLRSKGLLTVGAGENLQDARTPAVVERNGIKVAFLAYCSILKEGHAATEKSPGVAPLRVSTFYEPIDAQPGVPARPVTIANKDDVAAIIDDIQSAKQIADVVVLSMHWGVHFIPRVIADYQLDCADVLFDAGADLILGHHAHLPKAVTQHGGKFCFHSLGNFMITSPPFTKEQARAFCQKYNVELDPDYPRLRYGRNAHRALVARARLTRDGVEKASFLPVLVDRQLRPEIIPGSDERFAEAVSFLSDLSSDFDIGFTVQGDEVVLGPGK